MNTRKVIGLIFIFIATILSLANILSVKMTGAVIGIGIKSSVLTIFTLVFFLMGLLFLSRVGKGLAALVIAGAGVYAGHKLANSSKNNPELNQAKDYYELNKEQIQGVEITSPHWTEKGKFQRAYRYDVPLDIIEGIYAIPSGKLKGLDMRESYGDPLKLNLTGDGGAGPFMFSPGTAAEMGLKVSGYSKKTGADKKHGKELRALTKKYKNDYEKLAEIDERFNFEKAADAAARYLVKLHNKYGDWDKAVSAYNQGKPAPYAARTKHVKAVNNYQNYYNEKDTKDYYAMYKKGQIKNFPIKVKNASRHK